MLPSPFRWQWITALTVFGALAITEQVAERVAHANNTNAPQFQVDPFWPKMPKQWIFGQVTGIDVDAEDNLWVLHRPWSINSDEKARNPEAECCTAAPPVMEFDNAGNYIQGWGGEPADHSYEWPLDEHAMTVDYKGNIWISSAGGPHLKDKKENFILKFTKQGKLLMQIGRRGMSKGSLDTDNFNNAADIWVYPETNEVFVADGYVNRRVIVLDADTGKFKRMWGAYGNTPDDTAPKTILTEGPPPQQFNTVHGVKVSNDGLVYVNDRMNNRIQIFTIDGKFQREVFVERKTRLLGTSFATAFSPDAAQTWLYSADGGNGKVHIFDRKSMQEVSSFGRIGHYAGEFVFLHDLASDSHGNIFVAEVGNGHRVQKFLVK
jgi:hypothetical protein